MFSSILLIGAIGPTSFGEFVLRELVRNKASFKHVAVFNNISRPSNEYKQKRLQELSREGVEVISANDYASPTPYKGFDCVLSFLGNHGLHLQPAIIDAAIAAGVRHFYPSEYGADITVGANKTQRYYKYKVMTRDHLEKKTEDAPDLGWTLHVLGRLTEWAPLSHFGIDNANARAKIYGTENGRQSLISAADSAKFLVESLRYEESNAPSRRTLRLSGSTVTYKEIFEILERVTGRKYEVTYLDVESAIEEERRAKEAGNVDAELSASHKLIQGREGTLVPQPWDTNKFPNVMPVSVEDALTAAFSDPLLRKAYGVD
jgi:hypothetical protein